MAAAVLHPLSTMQDKPDIDRLLTILSWRRMSWNLVLLKNRFVTRLWHIASGQVWKRWTLQDVKSCATKVPPFCCQYIDVCLPHSARDLIYQIIDLVYGADIHKWRVWICKIASIITQSIKRHFSYFKNNQCTFRSRVPYISILLAFLWILRGHMIYFPA